MSTLGFTSGAYNYASGTRDAFGSLSDALVAEGHPPMVSVSGDREFADEVAIFTSRYRQQASGNGLYNDVRFWNGAAYGHPGGTRWVRVSGAGTVAAPGTSNHGKRRSNDLAWPYNTNTAASARAKQLAVSRNITREGEAFGELWHWTFWGQLGVIGQPAGATSSEEDDMPYTEPQLKKIIHDTVVGVLRAPEFSAQRILRGLCETEEFQKTPTYQNALTAVDRLYLALLGRHVDAPSQATRVYERLTGGTDAQLDAAIKASSEYKAKARS